LVRDRLSEHDAAVRRHGTIQVPRAASATFALEYALGVEPREEDFTLVSDGTVSGSREGTLGVLDFEKLPKATGPPPTSREGRDRYSVTLRLRVKDDRGLTAESRRSFFVLDDPDWMEFFPLSLGASGEAAPVVADLDADGRDEVILATADGILRILRWSPTGLREQRLLLEPGSRLGPTPPREKGAAFTPRETVIREPAVGDVLGRGEAAIVVASREGRVYAYNARGERLKGFPVSVRTDRLDPGPKRSTWKAGFSRGRSSPTSMGSGARRSS
jgi:hypothetical protein